MELNCELEPIRDLINENDSINSCMANIYCHLNHLETAIESENSEKFDLILGKMVINMTKLAAISGVSLEYCINTAFQSIMHPDGNC